MVERRIVSTSAGAVEIVRVPGARPPVLFFPGGHCSAEVDCGWGSYTASGHAIIAFSRPGYGATRVGPLSAAEFAPLVSEVCASIDVPVVAAAVGVSFGGLQAVHASLQPEPAVQRLVLHSAAPSCLPYPDSRGEAIGGAVLFSPLLQAVVWGLVHGMVRYDAGLRAMIGRLSTRTVGDGKGDLSAADRRTARALFLAMRSGSGFALDLRSGRARGSTARRAALEAVRCPTLVTGSRHDRGVAFAHAENIAESIPGARLVELDSSSHLFWIGRDAERLASIVREFLDA